MKKHVLIFCAGLLLLLTGCVEIPDDHDTVGKYNELGQVNTNCFQSGGLSVNNFSEYVQVGDGLSSQGFNVLNWNSYKGKREGWGEDFKRLSGKSDIVVLQEGYLTQEVQDLLDNKSYEWDLAKAFSYYDVYTGVLTASGVKPDFLCSFREFEPISGLPKTVMVTRYPFSGSDESLLLANIHMINFAVDTEAYRNQLEKMTTVLAQHQGPLIISGDFNSWSKKRLRILADVLEKLGLKPVTFAPDHRARFLGQSVDHIFYRQLVPLEAFTEEVTTSDHNPLLVTFRLADNS